MIELDFSKLNKSRIAVVGMGYIGNHLYSYLKSIRSIGNFELSFYNKSTLNEIVNKEFDFVFNCAGNTGDFKNNIWATVSSNLVLNHLYSFLFSQSALRHFSYLLF